MSQIKIFYIIANLTDTESVFDSINNEEYNTLIHNNINIFIKHHLLSR